MNSGYIIGYKRGDDGVEYRYLADANGNIVNAENAKATADLGAGSRSWILPPLCRKTPP